MNAVEYTRGLRRVATISWLASLALFLIFAATGLLTFGMGHASRQGYERFQRLQHDVQNRHVQRLRRFGPPALLLSFLPLVGDALVLAAGWLKLPFWQSMAWVAAGKAARYLLLLAGLLGLLSYA